jgi:DNA-binding transcriptional LysR family regulator
MATLRQLKALSLIAHTGSFTKAAERLFITQSAVSALIRELEAEVGTPLIVRGRSLRLTEAGEHVQRAGARAQQEVDRALQEVRGSGKWTERVLRVAAGSLSAATLMPAALAHLEKQESGLRVVLIDRPVGMVGDLLLSGEADVAVGSIDSPLRLSAELRSELLLSDTLCVVASAQGPLAKGAKRRRTGWADLEQSELVLVGRVGGQWNSLLQDQLAVHPGLRVGHEVQLLSTALELVRHDLGVAVLPRFATRQLDAKSFWVEDLHSPGAKWSTSWVTRKGPAGRDAGARLLFDALAATVQAKPLRA